MIPITAAALRQAIDSLGRDVQEEALALGDPVGVTVALSGLRMLSALLAPPAPAPLQHAPKLRDTRPAPPWRQPQPAPPPPPVRAREETPPPPPGEQPAAGAGQEPETAAQPGGATAAASAPFPGGSDAEPPPPPAHATLPAAEDKGLPAIPAASEEAADRSFHRPHGSEPDASSTNSEAEAGSTAGDSARVAPSAAALGSGQPSPTSADLAEPLPTSAETRLNPQNTQNSAGEAQLSPSKPKQAQRPPKWSPERDAVLRQYWPTALTLNQIRSQLNALPGSKIVHATDLSLRGRALRLGPKSYTPPGVQKAAPKPEPIRPSAPPVADLPITRATAAPAPMVSSVIARGSYTASQRRALDMLAEGTEPAAVAGVCGIPLREAFRLQGELREARR